MSAATIARERELSPSYGRCAERLLADVLLVDRMTDVRATGWDRLADRVGPALARTLRVQLLGRSHGTA